MSINHKNYSSIWRIALLIFVAHTFFFLIQLPQVYLYGSQSPQAGGVGIMVARLAWGTYVSAFITPFVLWLGYRLPITRRHLWRNLLLHLMFGIVAGVVQHFGYGLGLMALNLSAAETFRTGLFNLATLFNFISGSILRNAAIVGIQQAYLYFRESQERAFRLQQAELEMLKMQLRPHFFFNTLNAISALIYRSPKEADRMIIQLGDIFRIALKKDKTQEVSLKDELEFTGAFLQIHQTLMGKRLQIEWKIETEALNASVPNLILQPLAENAIQHGLAPLEAGGQITISAARQNGNLLLQLSDNGQGFVSNNSEKNDGIGLSNVRARLENLYGKEQKFSINEVPSGGVTVKLEIPFRELSTN
jgi:sensor histidine kinase YesM